MRQISVSDYLVEFLINKGISDVFGYQGGMIAYLFDSLYKYRDKISYHVPYNEQGAAFAACGYAQATGKLGFAFATSGPGFTNLLTGIANAYFDSIPSIFIAGQVNVKDKKHDLPVRQAGFQEIAAAEIAKPIVKKAYDIDSSADFVSIFEEAYHIATTGRKGPVFLDIPINVFRDLVEVEDSFPQKEEPDSSVDKNQFASLFEKLSHAQRPVIIAGAGINQSNCRDLFRRAVGLCSIPVVTTLPAIDVLPSDNPHKIGLIGSIGDRAANYIIEKSDFVLSIGSRLSVKQVGFHINDFAPHASLARIELDDNEFSRKIKPDEMEYIGDFSLFLNEIVGKGGIISSDHEKWLSACQKVRDVLLPFDKSYGNEIYHYLTGLMPDDSNIVLDVGKNQGWGGQSTLVKSNTKVFFSAGLGSMGYSLPASIGAFYGNGKPTFSFNGDGGFQMNVQELQTIAENRLPIKIFVLNNHSLGLIVLFQEKWLGQRYIATKDSVGDYHSADSVKIARAYGIKAHRIVHLEDFVHFKKDLLSSYPCLFEIEIGDDIQVVSSPSAGSNILTSGQPLPEEVLTEVRTWIG